MANIDDILKGKQTQKFLKGRRRRPWDNARMTEADEASPSTKPVLEKESKRKNTEPIKENVPTSKFPKNPQTTMETIGVGELGPGRPTDNALVKDNNEPTEPIEEKTIPPKLTKLPSPTIDQIVTLELGPEPKIENGIKKDNKRITKDSKGVTKDNKKDNKRVTQGNTTDNRTDNKSEKDNNVPIGISNVSNNIRSKSLATGKTDYRALVGNEKNLLGVIFHECLREGGLETGKLQVEALSSCLKLSKGTAKMAIHRLKTKGIIKVGNKAAGRGGWTTFCVEKDLYQKLQSDAVFFNFEPKRITERVTKRITNGPSSSSTFDSKNTTTSELPDSWKALDISGLETIGFRSAHIMQIFTAGKADLEMVSESLEALRHDLAHKKVPSYVKSPLALVMKNLRVKGEPYNSFDEQFETMEERAEREMTQLALTRRAQRENLRKQLFDAQFEDWKETLSEDEKIALKPSMTPKLEGPIFESALRSHFSENIFGKEE